VHPIGFEPPPKLLVKLVRSSSQKTNNNKLSGGARSAAESKIHRKRHLAGLTNQSGLPNFRLWPLAAPDFTQKSLI